MLSTFGLELTFKAAKILSEVIKPISQSLFLALAFCYVLQSKYQLLRSRDLCKDGSPMEIGGFSCQKISLDFHESIFTKPRR